ncbi:Uncharacterized protein RNJ44_00229 [Nakaseomyces bracarensis]|uniref:Uncharacterized protein n=1 Tax=Nakaseomyces bracarensis TaxID=273131 RepID=A0ABR4NTF0_9SACH
MSDKDISAEEEEDDDFGDFEAVADDRTVVAECVGELIAEEGLKAVKVDDNVQLEDLFLEERSRIIYEQLVELRTVLQPFSWRKSHMRSHLLHVLRLDEHGSGEDSGESDLVDDSLYLRINSLLARLTPEQTSGSSLILRDQFKYSYAPPMTHHSMQLEEVEYQEKQIPQLLMVRPETLPKKELEEYHDQICNAIDALIVALKQLEVRQSNLTSDKTTFENVVTNLTGHTQRLQRDEIALYNKHKNRRKRFSWIGR